MGQQRTADRATGSAGAAERSRTSSAPAPTSGVLALQRLAGNRAACAAIAAAPRRMLQRELKFKPRALDVAKASTGSAKGVAEFDAITKLLVNYYATRRVEERFAKACWSSSSATG